MKVRDTYKIILVGNSTVGKTSILCRFTDNKFNIKGEMTIGVEFGCKYINIDDNTKVKLQIWDTSGQEKFRSITRSYYRGSDGIIVVFDLSNLTSFKDIRTWINSIIEFVPDKPIILVGNKCDLGHKVTKGDILNMMEELNVIDYVETSAKNNINIQTVFDKISRSIYNDKKDEYKEEIEEKKDTYTVYTTKYFDGNCCRTM